ncbi:glycosyltransferases involved in cell wall biogenesis [Bifidobacterium dolichotidis]|uniref:Glycosyltransferases involved in cell wall biogenesis n=1 Tax=Bifidobacterium dolichotidis TaxID=2306976 RepID=A0A430FRN1_9BIFI|nr:glycosyltransferase [Bifidobacterium dolichotidis]RSX55529.1 glycosyltransferases involved in cell wall biogenesis [Bifidobacterium dolichotidis]
MGKSANDFLLSIIIPVYNVSKYLPRLVDSLSIQDLADVQIIFIDDGSTDNSLEILNSIDKFACIVIHQDNKGVAAARNNGLAKAKGRYYTFIDPDDNISPNYISKIKSNLRSNPDLLLTNFYYSRNGKLGKSLNSVISSREITPVEILKMILTGTGSLNGVLWGKVFSAKLFDSNPFPIQRAYSDHVPCIKAICRAKRAIYVKDAYYIYTADRSDSLQNKQTENDLRDGIRIIEDAHRIILHYYPSLKEYTDMDLIRTYIDICVRVCTSCKITSKDKRRIFSANRRAAKVALKNIGKINVHALRKISYIVLLDGYGPTIVALKVAMLLGK